MWKTLKKGVSEKFIDPEKEVTYQAGQIQIQVKADPVVLIGVGIEARLIKMILSILDLLKKSENLG